jgi:hypothetical protein
MTHGQARRRIRNKGGRMVTRREMVTTGALAALAGHEGGTTAAAQTPELIVAHALREMAGDLNQIRLQLREGLPRPDQGVVSEVRRQFTIFLRSNQKFPDFCDIGPGVFTEIYDWHVRFQQPIETSRIDNRTAIRFMFTWMILRTDQAEAFVGIPFDRG